MILVLMDFDRFPCAHLFTETIYYLYWFHGTIISVFHFVLLEPLRILTNISSLHKHEF